MSPRIKKIDKQISGKVSSNGLTARDERRFPEQASFEIVRVLCEHPGDPECPSRDRHLTLKFGTPPHSLFVYFVLLQAN
ncbi:hypothetical protein CDAR_482241 [Caerostris darwini]|uniref:Uncharacterized protein n=1 Tax=Caerostris darwini TaxID=1538125 RepID=A0AAV4TGA7_9ARAC|nr:hypothetical protein CDAR_482241 [Caerostris darwini]